jgi:MOSC domain-containing protein YiiM
MTDLTAIVDAVCLSAPAARVAKEPREEAWIGAFGLEGDRHAGETRISSRTGEAIPNRRQWSAVSTEEVEDVCRELGVPPFEHGEMGENLRLAGVRLATLPPGTVLELPGGARLEVSGHNDPCENAAAELGAKYGPVVQRLFVRVSYGRRGVVGRVLAPGPVRPGDRVRVLRPEGADVR